ncbi:Hypothetical protein SRAE_2000158600 [Strongyloides ratti]|uniref:Uncharacterized protein n=1 Tax=Strongyloides ratti TaxID=34506 RepID=A0A090LHE3_STRRB|nr:Hypothetical protein SRAE_2000158600 [Strongyloides ratti]CEF66920.2 Hypothetical protein SRAE_2000158600 [Strongyloides ratti]
MIRNLFKKESYLKSVIELQKYSLCTESLENTKITSKISIIIETLNQKITTFMNRVDNKNRNIYLDRLWNVFEANNFKFTLESINTKLRVWEENGKSFDVKEMLVDLETKKKLIPDREFMNHMIYQLAKDGMKNELDNFKSKLIKRNLYSDKEYTLAMIRCLSVKKENSNCDNLITTFIEKYDEDNKYEALSQAILGSSQQADLSRIYSLIRRAIVLTEKVNYGMYNRICLKHDVIMDVIWNLEVMSSPTNKNEIQILIEDLLNDIEKEAGYNKLLMRECERHINERHYNTAVKFINQLFIGFTKINNYNVDNSIEHLIQRILETSCILKFEDHNSHEKYDMLLYFINEIDSSRVSHHLIYPILESENDFLKRLSFIKMWKDIGYYDLTKLDFNLIYQYILKPIIKQTSNEKSPKNDFGNLQDMEETLTKYNIPEYVIFNWILNLKNYLNKEKKQYVDNISISTLNNWLEKNKRKKYIPKTTNNVTRSILEDYIKNQDFTNIHKIMIEKSIYKTINIHPYINKILEIYLQYGCWDEILLFLTNISNNITFSNNEEEMLSTEQIFRILYKFTENMKDIDDLIRVTSYIKMKFLNTCFVDKNINNILEEFQNLILKVLDLENKEKFTENHIDDVQMLMKILCNHFLSSSLKKKIRDREKITPYLMHEILNRLNWNKAVEVFLKFQSRMYWSNGLIILLSYSLENSNDLIQQDYLESEAKKYMPESQFNCFQMAALAKSKEIDVAKKEITYMFNCIESNDIINVFQLIGKLSFTLNTNVWRRNFLDLCLNYNFVKNKKIVLNFFGKKRIRKLKI